MGEKGQEEHRSREGEEKVREREQGRGIVQQVGEHKKMRGKRK